MPLVESIESAYIMCKSEQHRLIPIYDILRSFVLLVKHYLVTMEEDDNQFKINCQCCNGFLKCKGVSGELFYITCLRDGISTLGIYPEEIVPENFHFQSPSRTKVQHVYQKILKEGNGDHNYLRLIEVQDKNFDVLRSEIVLDKFDLVCA